MKLAGVVMCGLIALLCLSCATGPTVMYGDPEATETLTVDYGSTDLQMIAEKMVTSMLVHPAVTERNRPVVFVGKVVNKTSEHIDTKAITDKIRTALVRSGKVRATAVSDVPDELIEQLDYMNKSGLVNPQTAAKIGRQQGWDFYLYGEIMSITKRTTRVRDVYYKITLNLVDTQTALIEWADEKEIRKGQKRKTFGL